MSFKLKSCIYGMTDVLQLTTKTTYFYITGTGYGFSWKEEHLMVEGYL